MTKKVKVTNSSVIVEMIVPEDQMQQLIRIKDEVNRLKKKKKFKIAQSFDRLEVYNTTLPDNEDIKELLKLLTKARDVALFSHDDPYARDGLFLIDLDNWYIKVSAT